MKVADLNPVTWLVTGPTRHYFVHPDEVKQIAYDTSWLGGEAPKPTPEYPNPTNTYLISTVMADIDEGQTLYTELFDTKSKKYAYIGTESTKKEDKLERIKKPDWEDASKVEWNKNIIDWLASGRPSKANYCG
jgi:hypothetical protein